MRDRHRNPQCQLCTERFTTEAEAGKCHEEGNVENPASLSCSFLLASRIISSLLRCSIFWRASLLLAQPGAGDPSSLSLPFEFTLAWRLYRVIRSGGRGFRCGVVDEFVAFVGEGVNEIGG